MTGATQNLEGVDWKPVMATVLTFVLLGPPLGALTILTLREMMPDFTQVPFIVPPGIGLGNPVSIALGLVFLGLSYFAGGVQALATGIAISFYSVRRGRSSLLVLLAIAGLVFVVSYFAFWSDLPSTAQTMAIVHLVPALVCWLVTRYLWPVSP